MGAAVAKAEAAPANPGGRPTKLTPEVHRAYISAIRMGASYKLAAAKVHVSEQTVMEWIRRGEGTDHRSHTEAYASFASDVRSASTSVDFRALKALNKQLNGYRCKACNSGTIEDKEGRTLQCPCCKGTLWVGRPDGRLGLQVLERRVDDFARRDRVTHEHSHAVQVTGSITVEHTTTGAASALVALAGGQIAALLGGPPMLEVGEADVVDVEVVGEAADADSPA